MYEKKTASDHLIYFRATPHICIEMNKGEEEQDKTPIFKIELENEGMTRK